MNNKQPTFRQKCFSEIEHKGQLAWFTSIGCYPVFYITKQNCVLCASCAETAILEEHDDQPIGSNIHWEGKDKHCEECGIVIESAYDDRHFEMGNDDWHHGI